MTSSPPLPNTSSEVVQELLFQRPVQDKVSFGQVVRELPKLLRLGPAGMVDMCIAVWELALAHRTLRRHSVNTLGLLQYNQVQGQPETSLTAFNLHRISRVRYAFEVMAPRVPWRSDCLVQCIAARRWLARHSIASRIAVGIRRSDDHALLAHAWLCAGEIVVTGGDVSDFHEFRASKRTVT